jgi:hypothetical protein
MEDHPIVVASKMRLATAETQSPWSAEIVVEMGARVAAGGSLALRVTATNRGPKVWPAASRSGTGHVMLGVQLLDAGGRLVARDHHRVPLPHDVAPGTSVAVVLDCPAPAAPGNYVLKFDLVAEGVTWFETAGSPTVSRRVTVS